MREGTSSKKTCKGEVYANFSTDRHSRDWVDAVKYGFLSAGGGSRYSGQLRSLSPGERVWVKVAPYGFVGVGLVNGEALPAKSFKVKASGSRGPEIPVLQAPPARDLLPTVCRQPGTLRIFYANAVAANCAFEERHPGGRSIRKPEHCMQANR